MQNTKITDHPKWALKQKRSGTELRLIRDNYYLYEVTSKYNNELKRSKKITGKILGKVTEHGFIESKARIREKEGIIHIATNNISIKDFGHINLINKLANDMLEKLKIVFPLDWQSIYVMCCSRIINQFPLKKMELGFNSTFLSELFPDVACSPKSLGILLNKIGNQRNKITDFFKKFINNKSPHLLIDITSFVSRSKQMSINQKGYNKKGFFDSQINLLMIFSSKTKLPVYYRVLPGNIRDVSSFKLSLKEAGIKDAILIADKGFYSISNIENLEKNKLSFILPVRRNSSLIDYSNFKKSGKYNLKGHFKYNSKRIWYDEIVYENKKLVVYLNEQLRFQEEEDYLDRIESCPDKYSKEGFEEREFKFGTLSLLTNLKSNEEEIYKTYKTRIEVEKLADVLKNTLDVDKSYMQDEKSLEGWLFINHLASIIYYKIYNLLLSKKLLSKYSPNDIMDYLSTIKKIKINNNWEYAEIPGKVKKIAELLNISIT